MNGKNIISFSSAPVIKTVNEVKASVTRARSFSIKSHNYDFGQYANTVKAYAEAGMPFEHIANAGDSLGDEVDRNEIDAPLQEGWQTKSREIAEDENKILAWQNRGETVSNVNQIASPTTGREMVVVSQDLVTASAPNAINVVEGINVVVPENSSLESNPYLRPITEEDKKAA